MKYIILVVCISMSLFSTEFLNIKKPFYFQENDVVRIDWCSTHNWCKITDEQYFIPKHNLQRLNKESKTPTKYIVKYKTYKYLDNKLLEYNDLLILSTKRVEKSNNPKIKEDFKNGYTRASIFENIQTDKKYIDTPSSLKAKDIVLVPNKEVNLSLSRVSETIKAINNKTTKPIHKNTNILNDVFVVATFGFSKLTIDDTIGVNEDTSATNYDIGLGYRHTKNVFTTINFKHTFQNDIDIYQLYLTTNYIFNDIEFLSLTPQIGVGFGYSQLEWNNSPVTNTLNVDLKDGKAFYLLQFGLEKKLKNNISFITKYQLSVLNHDFKLYNNQSSIKHKIQQSILVGFKYDF